MNIIKRLFDEFIINFCFNLPIIRQKKAKQICKLVKDNFDINNIPFIAKN